MKETKCVPGGPCQFASAVEVPPGSILHGVVCVYYEICPDVESATKVLDKNMEFLRKNMMELIQKHYEA